VTLNHDHDREAAAKGLWRKLHPGIRSSLILGAFWLGLTLLQSFSAGFSLLLCFPIHWMLYIANGVLASRLATTSGYQSADMPKVGAIAGLVGWILPALFYLIFHVILGIVTFGVGFFGIATWIIFGPLDLAFQISLAALGAVLFRRYRDAQSDTEYVP
jgi:hypothetical protein